MASVVGSRLSRGAATIKPTTALTLTAAIAVAVMLRATVAAAQSGQIQGPDFQAWDLKFGLIAIARQANPTLGMFTNGTSDYRAQSCEVYDESPTLTYPLPLEPAPPNLAGWLPGPDARYGLTFEFTTTKPNVAYTLVITYPPSYPGGPEPKSVSNGLLPGTTSGNTWRFCFYQWSNDHDAQIPGRRCYQVAIEGVSFPEICVDVVNPNYVEPNAR